MTQPPLNMPPVMPPPVAMPMPGAPVQPARPRKGWFRRNLAWLIPVGCLTMLVIGAAVTAGAVWFGFEVVKAETPYFQALDMARENAEVCEALGTPIEPGWWVQFDIKTHNNQATARLAFPIHGPKGSGRIHFVATKTSWPWEFKEIWVEVEGRPERIDLLKVDSV